MIIHDASLPSSKSGKSNFLVTKPILNDSLCKYLQKCVWKFRNFDLFFFYWRFLKVQFMKGACYLKRIAMMELTGNCYLCSFTSSSVQSSVPLQRMRLYIMFHGCPIQTDFPDISRRAHATLTSRNVAVSQTTVRVMSCHRHTWKKR